MSPTHFCASSYRLRYIKISICLPSKSRSGSLSAIFQLTIGRQLSKSTNVIFTFFIFAKVWPIRPILTDTHIQIHRHKNGQAHGYSEVLQMCLKIVPKFIIKFVIYFNQRPITMTPTRCLEESMTLQGQRNSARSKWF